MSVLSKVIFGFSVVFDEIVQSMMTVCEYTIFKNDRQSVTPWLFSVKLYAQRVQFELK